LSLMTGKEIYVDIEEVKSPEIDAQLVAENVALQLERRVSFRRAMKKVLLALLHLGVKGIRVGPTLPAFLSPAVAKVLVETFDLKLIGTPEGDMADILGQVVEPVCC